MNRRGIFFTSLAIIVVALFLLSIGIYAEFNDRTGIKKRIESMDNFVFSLEQDISRQNYISGYRAILSLQSHITTEGTFINDSEKAIEEALINGSVNGGAVNLMEGFKLNDWNSKVSQSGKSVNANINYSLLDVHVIQEDPWNVMLEASIKLYVEDKGGLASWNKTEVIKSKIPISGFEDPTYLVHTNGKVNRKIAKSPFGVFVQGSDATNLLNHTLSGYYIASANAPSFLKRLQGDLSSDENGIESLVNVPELSSQGIQTYSKSVVDYIYFSLDNPPSYAVQGMPSWFRLDEASLARYGAG